MTAHESALAAIEARRALIAAGMSQPWRIGGSRGQFVDARTGTNVDNTLARDGLERIADSQLVVAAVNAYARDTDALEAVLLRHAPDPDPIELMLHMDEECPTGECENGDGHTVIVCRGCYPAWEDMQAHSVWPCIDAKTVLDVLGVDHE